jgi:hypothetical protein
MNWEIGRRDIAKRVRVRVRVTLRLAVYRQSVRFDDKPLETHDQYILPNEHLLLQSLYNILSHERMSLSFITLASPRQRSHSQTRVPRDSWPHFTVSDARLPGRRIYIPQEQGGPVIHPSTGFGYYIKVNYLFIRCICYFVIYFTTLSASRLYSVEW